MQWRTDQLCSHCQRQLAPQRLFSLASSHNFLRTVSQRRLYVDVLAVTEPTLFSNLTCSSLESWLGRASLPLGMSWRSSEAEISHHPSLLSQVGCTNISLHPKWATYWTPKQQLLLLRDALAKINASLPFGFYLLGFTSPACKTEKAASEASAETWGMAPASWKCWFLSRSWGGVCPVSARKLGRQHCAQPHWWGTSRPSKGV